MLFLFIKSVGLIPIALTMGGFLFLVFLLSYHTIKKSWQELEISKKEIIAIVQKKYQVLLDLARILSSKGDYLNHEYQIISLGGTLLSSQVSVSEQLRALIALLKQETVILALIQSKPDLLSDAQVQECLKNMHTFESTYHRAHNRYGYAQKYYNEFVSKMPSKLVAKLAGFKTEVSS